MISVPVVVKSIWSCAVILIVEVWSSFVKVAFHDADTDTDTDILAKILADTSDTRDRFPEVISAAS